jgi:hypothetical protein
MPRLAVILAAGLFGLVGCRSQPVSRSEFLARGNAVCAAATDHVHDLAAPPSSTHAAPEQYVGYVDDYVAELRLELTNLRAIGYPPDQRVRLERDYQALDTRLAAAERDPLGFRPQQLAPYVLALRHTGLSDCRP